MSYLCDTLQDTSLTSEGVFNDLTEKLRLVIGTRIDR